MIDQQAVLQCTCLLQPLPASVHRLSALASQPDPDLPEIVDAVGYDAVLTTRLLRVANSALYRRNSDARTVKEAVVRMGTGMVLGLATAAAARPLVAKAVPGYGISSDDFWRHSVLAALAGEVSRPFAKQRWSPSGFTAALLQNFGKLVLGHFITSEHLSSIQTARADQELEPFEAEQKVLGIHHAKVGAFVVEHWQLPEEIVEAVLHHHDPETSAGLLPHVVCFANMIATDVMEKAGQGRLDAALLRTLLDRLGIAAADLPRLSGQVEARFAQLDTQYQ